ncbi:molybdate/tungstate transport system substrate-binding protein [Halogranum amylolyticum]|uniref:Molybdate/tungstate transport system substrate-binding protein n=1 Tax=Halogranum amylolyticum TaxID=660520 RepID=A0A1H8MZL4_9EURY|nr:extracellular solute-binding protein [Halogranum amylolyticum]SEO22678.1 molybdate/tungstate transport system substrate-binding protein [Halogranum amylolyticum]
MMSNRRRFLRRVAAGGLTVGTLGTVGLQGVEYVTGGPRESQTTPARALVAGSLLVLADDVAGADVEAHGSLTARNLVVDGARDPDVLALADPDLFSGITAETTLFATNALVLAYDPESRYADAIADDWATGLAREGVRVGQTDPKADPLGYRTVLAMRLADDRGLAAAELLDDSLVFPETALMRTLEAGKIDAAFVYENMAVEHDLPFVDLPPAIDFSDPARVDTYATVSLDLPDRTVRGAPIRYGVTALTDAGAAWADSLATDRDRLRDHGFTVPDDYPLVQSIE